MEKELRVGALLLCVEKTQLRWFGHLIRMLLDTCFEKLFRAYPFWGRPQGRTRTCWMHHISNVAWKQLGIPQEELEDMAAEVGATSL